MIEILILALIVYFVYKTIFRLTCPEKFFLLKVLKIYEFSPNNLETILNINQYSDITKIVATESQMVKPEDNLKYEHYQTINKVNTGSGFMVDTRTGALVTRCTLWKRI